MDCQDSTDNSFKVMQMNHPPMGAKYRDTMHEYNNYVVWAGLLETDYIHRKMKLV